MTSDFEAIVEGDLQGTPMPEEFIQRLHGNKQKWRDVLAERLQDIDTQLTQRRAEWLKDHLNNQKRVAYEKWKGPAVGYKLAVVSRLRDVKALLKVENMAEKEQDEYDYKTCMKAIRADLNEIKSLLLARTQRD
jgi:hypothetical protein